MTTASDHEATVKGRAEELAALAKAKEILAGTSAGAAEQTYSLLQMSASTRAASRIQTRADLANSEVVTLKSFCDLRVLLSSSAAAAFAWVVVLALGHMQ